MKNTVNHNSNSMQISFLDELDTSNFFYQNIVTLAYSQFGINELLARGFYKFKKSQFTDNSSFIKEIQSYNFPIDVEEEILNTKTFTPLIYVPGFLTKDRSKSYEIDIDESARKLFSEDEYPFDANSQLTYLTIIAAWEKAMVHKLQDKPVLQFFRHIRNAAAHNGRFHFDKKVIDEKSGELKKKAQWNQFEIKSSLQNMKLIPKFKEENEAFWDQGDLVEFLIDFENYYPELKM
ncbi:MAG: hypothetical protein JZU47_00345 [Prolixibacteraceae bacterium]|nr:hypothetical protein [Prolixibacteraceae bacterium]